MNATADKPVQFLPAPIRARMALQPQLDLGDPRFRPLSTVQSVLRDLAEFDLTAAQIREMVESRFLVGFNIAVDDRSRCELRVLTKSIIYFRSTGGKKYHEPEWDKIFRLVVPHKKPVVTGKEIWLALLCHASHVEHLISAECLKALQKSKPGPGGSFTVCRESYEAFLKGRML